MLAVHISNRYIDLVPVCARSAQAVNRSARVVTSSSDGTYDTSIWVIVTSNRELLARPEFGGSNTYEATAPESFRGWSDQYSSVWPLLRLAGKAATAAK